MHINILMRMHIHSWCWPSFNFAFFYFFLPNMKVCYFNFYIYIFCSFAKVQGFFSPPLSSHAFCLLFCDFTWESIDYIKSHVIEVPACWTCMVILFVLYSPSVFYVLVNELLLGKELLLSMAFIHFFHFPITFLEYGLKKWKEHHAIILPMKKLIHTVDSLLRANWKQFCEGESKDLVSKRNSPSGT